MDKDHPFPFCSKKIKTVKESMMCEQHKVHQAMTENSIGFAVFYVFIVIFIALLFQLTKKNFNNKRKK